MSTILFLPALANSSSVTAPSILTRRHEFGKTESVSE